MASARLRRETRWIRTVWPDCGARAARCVEVAARFRGSPSCYNDLVAVGALHACRELGRNVPGSVAIVGFDDIPVAALVTPALTTCRVSV